MLPSKSKFAENAMRDSGCGMEQSVVRAATSVLLADGHEIFRGGLRSVLAAKMSWLNVVGEVGDCGAAVQYARKLSPDVIVLDSDLPPVGGLEAIRRLRDCWAGKILFICGKSEAHLAQEVIQAGARGCILKSASVRELSLALEAVSANDVYIECAIEDALKENIQSTNRDIKVENSVTSREREVLQLLSEGHTTKEMAELLEISVRTVETHRLQIMNKLNLHSTAELTKYSIRHGFTCL
jgi:DNA-binding NarL/FixJ family response regulator